MTYDALIVQKKMKFRTFSYLKSGVGAGSYRRWRDLAREKRIELGGLYELMGSWDYQLIWESDPGECRRKCSSFGKKK